MNDFEVKKNIVLSFWEQQKESAARLLEVYAEEEGLLSNLEDLEMSMIQLLDMMERDYPVEYEEFIKSFEPQKKEDMNEVMGSPVEND